jgi:hypothetical protein
MKQPNPRRAGKRPQPPSPPPEARPSIDGTVGIWVNKRTVSFLDLPFRHRLVGEAAGWRVEVMEEGKLVVHGKAGRRGIDVEEGDFVLSSGDDIYVGLQRAEQEPEEPRDDSRDQKNEDRPADQAEEA